MQEDHSLFLASIFEAAVGGAVCTSRLRTSWILEPTSSALHLDYLRLALAAYSVACGFLSAWTNKVSISLMTWLELSSNPYSQ
jgi:hypothetical protein